MTGLGTSRPFSQVDVFTDEPYRGNPVAVVHDADGLTDAQMAAFARWTNLSETTFLLRPTDPAADYRLRIFTPGGELPFAGHPTLGSCHAWLAAGGRPARGDEIVQECGVGPVVLRRGEHGLRFAAPEPREDAPVDAATLDRLLPALGLPPEAVMGHRLLDNGPRWHVLLLDSAERVLSLRPDWAAIEGVDVGVVGPHPAGGEAAFEVRGFAPGMGLTEDPVTGSLNASIGQWLIGTGRAPERYVAAQGTALGRAGRVHVERDADGTVWVGGATVTCIEGTVRD
ncbi:PhzF family phenazine biosynthesis protein [Cellulomonas pakistanensis]|uniref:Phenazine biosynthesis protein PhzF n=1 Tax=Cellulomonas pakistanensis TaxID=992287 RepID=A0A919P9Q4_9CELL|nr:PhzF family phenazine biosynthesis protein [Cellulomonas pakistanensis]GIG34687.1 phenazine biosynthesis protein PhzF [Cellulomonas pakistanensis]